MNDMIYINEVMEVKQKEKVFIIIYSHNALLHE